MNVILLPLVVSLAAILRAAEGTSCDIVPIEQWTGSPSGFVEELSTPVGPVVVTHTDTSGCDTDEACERLSRSICNNHMQQGFADIRLSFLVGGNGKIYEGAGWKVGRHSTGYNNRSVSLSFIGDFRETLPSEAALKAAERFLDCYLNTRFLGCEYKVVGHRQVVSTTSPGDALQSLIQSWPHWTEDTLKL